MSASKESCVTAVVGAQWGDEGKGKLVHLLSRNFDLVVRYQGGENAGHTVETDGQTYRFRLLPSGILYSHVTAVLGRGMVVNPISLAAEIDELSTQGAFRGKLIVDRGIQLVLRAHQLQDQYSEEAKDIGGLAVGTTRRGIGPAYADKHFRVGIKAGDLLRPRAELRQMFCSDITRKNALFAGYYGQPQGDAGELWAEFEPAIEKIAPYIADAVSLVMVAKEKCRPILCEGAQGVLLDLDYGTYPYVTSSHPGIAGALSGTGINWTDIGEVIGVTKAYTTRVGNGPFPTEELGPLGELMRERGAEYGTVTKRPRRCGWLDLVLLKYAREVVGITKWAVTKVDVLDELSEILSCNFYVQSDHMAGPTLNPEMDRLGDYLPRYSRLSGWNCDTTQCRRYADLPSALINYLKHIEVATKTPVAFVSVGPATDAVVWIGAEQVAMAEA
ncbi:adenylosuccinate synthase [Patescibacteria group bacterium]|nr:adenylosuccinate synthase [Patescibacteria group bacterium]